MTSILKTTLVATAALAAAAFGGAAQASVTTGSLAAWKAAVGTFSETTDLGASDGSFITGFTTADGVAVGVSDQVHSIGDGWATWSGGYTGQILADYGSTSVTFTLASAVKGFGLFLEPDPFGVINITLNTDDGATLTQAVNGNGGAAFFGWTGGNVHSFTITSSSDFGAGDVFSAAGSAGVPEPAAWAMMLVGFGGIGGALRASRRRQAVAATA